MVIATIPLARKGAGNLPSAAYLVIGGLAIIWGALCPNPTVEGVLTLVLGVGLVVFGLVK
jgi:hypothetical protein